MKILTLFYCSHWYLELKTTNVNETFGLSIEIKLYLINDQKKVLYFSIPDPSLIDM